MPGSVPSTLCGITQLILIATHEEGTIVIPILQVREPRPVRFSCRRASRGRGAPTGDSVPLFVLARWEGTFCLLILIDPRVAAPPQMFSPKCGHKFLPSGLQSTYTWAGHS